MMGGRDEVRVNTRRKKEEGGLNCVLVVLKTSSKFDNLSECAADK
jgi:hypothetical protein